MSTGIFGPRGPSYSYNTYNYANTSYFNSSVSPYHKSAQYPAKYSKESLYPSYSQFPYQPQIYTPNLMTYSWGKPEITLPSKGLESILVAILVLVVLDLVFVRPLKNSESQTTPPLTL